MDKASDNGETPLFPACGNGHLKIVDLLLQHGANMDIKSKIGQTPLSAARQYNKNDIEEALLKAGAKLVCE